MYKKILSTAVLSIMLIGQSLAADDVYVDLSVLDAIPQDSIGFVASQPLFPVIKKTTPSTPKKIKATKQIKKPTTKVVKSLKRPEPVKPKLSVEKEERSVKIEEPQKIIEKEQEAEKTESQPQIAEEPVKVIEYSKSDARNEEVTAPKAEEITGQTPQEIKAEVNQEKQEAEELQAKQKDIQTEKEQKMPKQDVSETSVEAPEEEKAKEPQILSASISDRKIIEQSSAIKLKEVYAISFEKDMTELSSEALKTLDVIIQSFDKNSKKKISIKAYNCEDGKDSFRKKRISLNRATEVRSYLLSHGFKNFSIKIINTTSDNEYKDIVELEQIN